MEIQSSEEEILISNDEVGDTLLNEKEGDEVAEGEAEENDDEEEDEDDVPEISIKIQNVVATINLGTRIELSKVAQAARNAEYNPTRFHAVIMRIREPRTTALIFSNGKMIITGANNETESRAAAAKYTAIVFKIGFPVSFNDYKIQNMTATFNCGFPIRLESFLYAYHSNCTYEPELFPGLTYRMVEPKVVLLIFVSGKVVLTGAKSNEAIGQAFQEIYPKLGEFRKRNIIISTITSNSSNNNITST